MHQYIWTNDDNAVLLTDLYQLTMLQAYVDERMDETAVFDLFFRRMRKRNYLLAAGLDTVLHYLETLRFTDESLQYLDSLGIFGRDFLEYLEDFRFTGSVYAMPEGTPFFPDESVLQVVAPIPQAQLVETFILNQITFQTNAATKARRVIHAAAGRPVADFGARRMHGADATMRAARAYSIAGLDDTSNVLAAAAYGMNASGTMAHSYIEAHDNEDDAFRRFARLYPGTTLLVDTYDTLDAVRRIVNMAKDDPDGFQVGAVRLDSGDMAELAFNARRILDDGGLTDVRIFASGSLDEYKVAALVDSGAPIDAFGVGTSMGTIADLPYLDSAYKLVRYGGKDRMKLAENKTNLPGLKQVYRHYDGDVAAYDTIALMDEAAPEGAEPLVTCVMKNGERTADGRATLADARRHAETHLSRLPSPLHHLDQNETPYDVRVSRRLREKQDELRRSLEKK